jgi:hypothetical protein
MAAISGRTSGRRLVVSSNLKARLALAFGQHFGQFFADSVRRRPDEFQALTFGSRLGCGLDLVIEARGETHGSEHAQFVFGETAVGIADGADDSGLQVGLAAYKIQNLVGGKGSNIMPLMVKSRRCASSTRVFGEADFVGMTAVGVG